MEKEPKYQVSEEDMEDIPPREEVKEKLTIPQRIKRMLIRDTPRETAAAWVTLIYLCFQIYRTFIHPLPAMLLRPVHVASIGLLCLLYHPGKTEGKSKAFKLINEIMNWIVYLGAPYVIYYSFSEYSRLNGRIAFLDPVLLCDKVVCVLLIFMILLGIWRTVGKVLSIFISVFIVYVWVAPYMPGFLHYQGMTFTKFVDLMVMGTAGIFGSASGASAGFMYWIMIFGRLFAFCGGGAVLIDIGMKAGSKAKDNSGPAKAAVLASGLMGMISGSAASNVAGTGVITIPLMKKVGYAPEDAGAIEAVASTGGQIMPPIMGTGAFLMAELLGISYFSICRAAIVPAGAYYFGVFVLVTMMAKRVAAKTRHRENADWRDALKIEPILPRLYLLLPVISLVVFIGMGYTLQRAALYAILVILIMDLVSPALRHGPLFFLEKLLEATKLSTSISMPISGCGIIIGVVSITGLATKLSSMISSFAGEMMWVGLIMAMLGCMILGMALPTVAAYLTAYVLFIPTLVSMGITPLAANMFIFYFGIFAQITPPVCVASYTAAGIAEASSWKTGWKGMAFAACAFFAPFMFVYQPGILLSGPITDIILQCSILLMGTYSISVALGGYFVGCLDMWQRILLGIGGCCVCIPEKTSDFVGLAILVAMLVIQLVRKKAGKLEYI